MALTPSNMLPLGTKAPNFHIRDVISDNYYSLDDLKSVTERYLTGGDACYAVVGPADKLDSLADFEKFSV